MPYKIRYKSAKTGKRDYVRDSDGRIRIYGNSKANRIIAILDKGKNLHPTKIKVK